MMVQDIVVKAHPGRHSSVKKMKPPVFSCDPRDFASFQRDFRDIVVSNRPDAQAQRYTMLNECLPSEAKQLVMNLPTMDAIISIMLRDITKPSENKDQQQALMSLIDKIERGMTDLETIGTLCQLTNKVVVSKIETKLSTRIILKWFEL